MNMIRKFNSRNVKLLFLNIYEYFMFHGLCVLLYISQVFFLYLVTFLSHIFMLQTILQLVEKQSIPHKYVFQTSLHVNRNRFETYIK